MLSMNFPMGTAADRAAWAILVKNALSGTRRLRCYRDPNASAPDPITSGTEFLNVALTGEIQFDPQTGVITHLGIASDAQVRLAVNLATGKSVFRITSGNNYIQGTLGLAGSGCDLILSGNPTATSGIGFTSNFTITPPSILPLPAITDGTPPTVSLSVPSSTVITAGGFVLTANVNDNVGVTKVEFYRGNALVGSAFAAPFTVTDTLSFSANGSVSYTARAYDAANNMGVSQPQQVTVNIPEPVETGTEVAIGAVITTITVEETSGFAQTNIPWTFAHPFKIGAMPMSGAAVELRAADNSVIPAQIDVKPSHPDGSVRHAIISAIIPSLSANESKTYSIVRKAPVASATPATATSFVSAGLDTNVTITEAGVAYSASLASLMSSAQMTKWLTGGIVNEWLLSGPLKTAEGVEHPLIHVRFAVRAFSNVNRAKIDVILENTWCIPDPNSVSGGSAWVNNSPRDVVYDLTITTPGDATYTKTAITHADKARVWITKWWNGEVLLNVKHNVRYVIDTKALPNYDTNVNVSLTRIASDLTKYLANSAPMQSGLLLAGQGITGQRSDIAINPAWNVTWFLTGNKDAAKYAIGTAKLDNGYAVHYRNKATDRPVSILEHPYVCLSVGSSSDDLNKVTNRHEKIPFFKRTSTLAPDAAHAPCCQYIPYLLTGDYHHLEALQFRNEWHVINTNPAYRLHSQGHLRQQQIRGIAWTMRHLAYVAYISPDNDPIKPVALTRLDLNLDFFNGAHTVGNDPLANNNFGMLNNPPKGYRATRYNTEGVATGSVNGENYACAPWMDDYNTMVWGMMVELGFTKARPMAAWKAEFAVGRIVGNGFCWIQSCHYNYLMRDTADGPLFTDWSQVYNKTVPESVRNTPCATQEMADANTAAYGGSYELGEVVKYAHQDGDNAAILTAALAYARDSDHPLGDDAWTIWDARPIKPTYANMQHYNIRPRSLS